MKTNMSRNDVIQQAADRIQNAYDTGQPDKPVRHLLGEGDIDAAYKVQEVNTKRRLERGARLVGRKIGLTSKTVQKQLGVDRPDFGMLFHDMAVPDGEECVIASAGEDWEQLARNFEAARRTSSAARSDEWG